MEITERLIVTTRHQWREWLIRHHAQKHEIWLALPKAGPTVPTPYIDAVEEALCFGWIDSTVKSADGEVWRRFSPRRPRSSWTELNKERCRRLERLGLMTDAGRAVMPDMDFHISPDILQVLQSDPILWQNFQSLPPLYVRVRIGNIQNLRQRNPAQYHQSLQKFIHSTRQGILYGQWNDAGRLL